MLQHPDRRQPGMPGRACTCLTPIMSNAACSGLCQGQLQMTPKHACSVEVDISMANCCLHEGRLLLN